MKIVLVEWLDAKSESDWKEKAEIAALKVEPTKTAGFLVRKGRDAIVIAQTVNTMHMADFLTIPRGMVQKITELT